MDFKSPKWTTEGSKKARSCSFLKGNKLWRTLKRPQACRACEGGWEDWEHVTCNTNVRCLWSVTRAAAALWAVALSPCTGSLACPL